MSHAPTEKKLVQLSILLLLAFSLFNLGIMEVFAVESPAIYVDPALIRDTTLTPGSNFTVAITTDYNGTDITSWQFTLNYNPSVLHGGLNDTDTWTGDGVTSTFNTTKTPLVAGSEVVYVNDTLATKRTQGNDTWTGDGVTKTFNTTKKPLVLGEDVPVYVGETRVLPANYTVNYSEGIIEFKESTPAPALGAEVRAAYDYGHYTVGYSEGKINFLTLAIPANGTKIEATYTYEQYSVDYSEGKIKFFVPPDEGAKIDVIYLYGGVTNGDLITLDMPRAAFTEGTFNNTLGQLSVTNAYFFPLPSPIPVTSGPGTLATIAFTVVGEGTSNLTLEKLGLVGVHDGDTYIIVNDTMPAHIQHGYFSNIPEHDIAVTDVTSSLDTVEIGQSVSINVSITNTGDFNETFNIALYADMNETVIGDEITVETQTDISLNAGNSKTLTFTWNTAGVTLGDYTITASATLIPGETVTTDNTFTGGVITIKEKPTPGIQLELYLVAAGIIAIVIVAIAFYYLRSRKTKPT